MTEKLITIEKRFEKVGKTGQAWLLLEAGGQSYSCWEAKLFASLQIGAKVNCRIEAKGKWTNILDILPDDGQLLHPRTNSTVAPGTSRPPESAQYAEIIKILNRIEEKIDGYEAVDSQDIKPETIPF